MLFVTLTLVAADPPIVTEAPDTKFVPVIVIEVPPAVLPEPGEIDVTVGAGAGPLIDFARIVLSFFSVPGDVFK